VSRYKERGASVIGMGSSNGKAGSVPKRSDAVTVSKAALGIDRPGFMW
jgi:hypothetical protein